MTKIHINTPMTKEQIFTQLDVMPNDTIRAEFIDHLHKIGTITERQAIDLTTEYIKHQAKNPRPKGFFF